MLAAAKLWKEVHNFGHAAIGAQNNSGRFPQATFPAAAFIQPAMPLSLSDEHLTRIKEKFRQTLGRDLTPDEMRYLGFSLVALPDYDFDVANNSPAPEVVDEVA